ncbi:hypothetical protein HMPREF9130_1092 [Peptoniphilus sp. oral taxon 375 str. F0436]|nr:hypothetical protein HMPREF9130_1092 [Peptoniphilus sp. oral taxon 375 str. F0436]
MNFPYSSDYFFKGIRLEIIYNYVKDFSVDDTGLLWLYVGDTGWVTHNNFQ